MQDIDDTMDVNQTIENLETKIRTQKRKTAENDDEINVKKQKCCQSYVKLLQEQLLKEKVKQVLHQEAFSKQGLATETNTDTFGAEYIDLLEEQVNLLKTLEENQKKQLELFNKNHCRVQDSLEKVKVIMLLNIPLNTMNTIA